MRSCVMVLNMPPYGVMCPWLAVGGLVFTGKQAPRTLAATTRAVPPHLSPLASHAPSSLLKNSHPYAVVSPQCLPHRLPGHHVCVVDPLPGACPMPATPKSCLVWHGSSSSAVAGCIKSDPYLTSPSSPLSRFPIPQDKVSEGGLVPDKVAYAPTFSETAGALSFHWGGQVGPLIGAFVTFLCERGPGHLAGALPPRQRSAETSLQHATCPSLTSPSPFPPLPLSVCIDLDFIGSAITFCSLGQMAGILNEEGECVSLFALLVSARCVMFLHRSRVATKDPCAQTHLATPPPHDSAGDIPNSNIAFMADAIASMLGGLLGSSGGPAGPCQMRELPVASSASLPSCT